MDFNLGEEAEAFREEVKAFVRDRPPEEFPHDGMDGGYGSGAHSKAYIEALARKGWLTMTWPKRYGGRERPFFLKLVLLEELAFAGAPFGPLVQIDQAADAFIRYGSDELKSKLLPEIARGRMLFWQGFSEPSAGSDLLSLKTEAAREGDDYVVNGHKIWSSHAGIGDYGFVLARTNREARRHLGISMFIIANDTPGMDIRPIRSMASAVYHYEVFLNDVRVPRAFRLGEEDEGFVTLLKGLDSDRFWGRFYKAPRMRRVLGQLVEHAKTRRRGGRALSDDLEFRRRIARFGAEVEVLRTLFWRCGWMLREGQQTPYETALYKVQVDELGQRLAAFAMEVTGPSATLEPASSRASLQGGIRHLYLSSMGQTVAGGTSEVLRTTVATRGLGLPKAG
jgi:3-oxocholest-4-en-26-oyl-CoA dehydrogenase alpha subunit